MAGVVDGIGAESLSRGRAKTAVYQVDYQELNAARQALFLGFFLAILQMLDGILTSMGVSRFGLDIEGNPLVRTLMAEFGHIQALSVVKVTAIIIVFALTWHARTLPWLRSALGAISCVYLLLAILPWTYILFIRPVLS